jgi:3-hydroxyisobutyrate dehydrogenase
VTRSVAVIVIGAMGSPIATRIQRAGFELAVCDRNLELLVPFAEAGARIAESSGGCAGADLVIVLVTSPDQVRDVILGEHGIARGATAERKPLVAVMSTVPAALIEELGQALGPMSVRLIDSPISGGVTRAEQGTLAIMSGGHAQDVESVRDVFACLAARQFHCGALGSGQAVKVINNLLGIANAVLGAEAYRLALGQGFDLALISEVLEASSGRNWLTADPHGPQAAYDGMTRDRQEFSSLRYIMRKDVGLAVELAAATSGEFPALQALEAMVAALDDSAFDAWRSIADAKHPS